MDVPNEKYDMVFVLDSTASMSGFLQGVRDSLPQFMLISKLVGNIDRFAVTSYKDYCDQDVLQWSGWKETPSELFPFVSSLKAMGGGDSPEAAKTALNHLNENLTRDKKTLVFWYTDACPHSDFTHSQKHNLEAEKQALGENFDWFTIINKLRDKCHIFPILYTNSRFVGAYWIHAAESTGGICINSTTTASASISHNTIALFLNIIGEPNQFNNDVVWVNSPEKLDILSFDNEADFINLFGNVRIDRRIVLPNLIQENTGALVDKFFGDKSYKKTVYQVFETLLEPSNVLALSYNPIFGKLWRAICKSRGDDERNSLVEKLGHTIGKLPPNTRKDMERFIELSYNQQDEIDFLIKGAKNQYPALIYDGKRHFATKEILELSRSCNGKIMGEMMEIITGLTVVESGNLPKNYIPLSLKPGDILSLIPSLVSDGIMFSKRPSLIIAILALKCKSTILSGIARDYIQNIRGKWLDREVPENYIFSFVKLVTSCPEALTESEQEFYRHLYTVGGLQINKLTDLNIDTGYTSHKTARPDEKISCQVCKQMRSFTLISQEGICGFCCDMIPEVEEKYPDKSYWCECRTCKVHYAVVQIDKLNVEPKCHFCRIGKVAPVIDCGRCYNRFLYQSESKPGNYRCPPCKMSDGELRDTLNATFYDWVKQNNLNLLNLTLTDIDRFWSCNSIYKGQEFLRKSDSCDIPLWSKKKILNLDSIKSQMLEWIRSGNAELGTCNLCFEDLNKKEVAKTCKNKKCGITACKDCLTTWYAQSHPGQIVHLSNLTCPFCKCHPGLGILQKYNPEICTLKRFDPDSLDHSWYYAWCVGCYSLRECVEKTCAGEGAPDIKDWRCEPCDIEHKTAILGRAPDVNAKECPGCGVMTEKISGCNHIHCLNIIDGKKCDTHFCFVCGEKSNYNDIYGHLSREHGGFFGGGGGYGGYESDGYNSYDSYDEY